MDYIRRFDIHLDREYVYPGQYLTGHVMIDNRENIKIRNIRASLRGKAHVEWKVMKSGERRTVKDDQYFLDEKLVVWGKEKTDESIPILPRGHHELPFKFLLPEPANQPMPCSFESKTGTIRYYIKVTIDIPYASPPQGIKYFTLIGPTIDCGEDKYLTPVIAQDIKVLCCLCCRRGPISLHCTLPRTAYCSGERLHFTADVNNQSNEPAQLRLQLFQYVEYFIDRGPLGVSKDVSHLVLQAVGPEVEPDSTWKFVSDRAAGSNGKGWELFKLTIPVVPPTLVGVCRLIQIYYLLKVCVYMKNSGEDLHMEFPITIGTKPVIDRENPIPPSISYDVAADHVEGGQYISPEFQIGQVYDGSTANAHDPSTEEVILYRPTYVNLVPPRTQQQQQQQQHSAPVASTSRGAAAAAPHNDESITVKRPHHQQQQQQPATNPAIPVTSWRV
ncbi:putative Arrestin domain-containing protein 2 [Hypsibius exemplaris]|uniref:Arrestin domain-containing protein 2 n=1 Tax=Hypsibius exemplaris TaxID=2072580 RepID=A0A9X6N8Q2_HYPEX|nr:putative Arrestin domain-containing protein 2 [Hypsibius exemplaris]